MRRFDIAQLISDAANAARIQLRQEFQAEIDRFERDHDTATGTTRIERAIRKELAKDG